MDTLTNKELISILKYLPPQEYTKYARICRRFGELISNSNPLLPKIQREVLRLTVGQRKECRFVRNSGMLTIHKNFVSFAVTILESGAVKLLQVNNLGRQMLNDFYKCGVLRRAKEEKPFCEVDVFLMWLFSQADFESIEFVEMGRIAEKVKAAIGPSRATIHSITLKEPFGNNGRLRRDPFSLQNMSRFFKSITEQQEELDMRLKLIVVPCDTGSYIRHSSHVQLLNEYRSIFADVSIVLNRTCFFAALCAVGERWIERKLTETKFRMTFTYNNEIPPASNNRNSYCQRFLNFPFTLVNMSADTFAKLADYDGFEKFPEHLQVEKKIDSTSLRLYFSKVHRNICLKAEVTKY